MTLLLDEAAHLGKIQVLEDAITLLRAYGLRIVLYFQSVNQLQKVYGDNAQTILDNCHTQIFFGTNAYESAEHISKRIGDCTIIVESINRNWNRSRPSGQSKEPTPGSIGSGSGNTVSEAGRRLFRPEEILVLPRETFIAFHRNHPPIAGELIPWYAAAEFKKCRTGQSRGVGLSGVALALVSLLLSLVLAAFVARLPGPGRSGRGGDDPFYPLQSWQAAPPAALRQARPALSPLPYGNGGRNRRPVYRPNPYRRSVSQDRFNFWDPSSWAY